MTLRLLVGLANPGKEYAPTRHNAGEWWVQALCQQFNISCQTQTKLQASIGEGQIHGNKVKVAIPTTYMNHSGQALGKIVNYFKIELNQILVIHDELDFAPGTIRLKVGGGHGGHNGLRDIIPQLGSANFARLRIGIGHPGDRSQVADYVLAKPSNSDKLAIDQAIADSLNFSRELITGDWQNFRTNIHQK